MHMPHQQQPDSCMHLQPCALLTLLLIAPLASRTTVAALAAGSCLAGSCCLNHSTQVLTELVTLWPRLLLPTFKKICRLHSLSHHQVVVTMPPFNNAHARHFTLLLRLATSHEYTPWRHDAAATSTAIASPTFQAWRPYIPGLEAYSYKPLAGGVRVVRCILYPAVQACMASIREASSSSSSSCYPLSHSINAIGPAPLRSGRIREA
jgi:hypothetical protein